MRKRIFAQLPAVFTCLITAFACLIAGCISPPSINPNDNILVLTDQDVPESAIRQMVEKSGINADERLSGDILGRSVTIVKLRGKTNHFGNNNYHATVPYTKVWISEYPQTRDMNVQTDSRGWWTLYVVKDAGADLEFSFIYEKEGWITTKTNVNTIQDEDNLDYAIQFIDPLYFKFGMKPVVESSLRDNGYPNISFENAMVVTVGKSWASMHDDRLPHGDEGAIVTISPASDEYVGPIYFDESVFPDLDRSHTSHDGGVNWVNMPVNTYYVSAQKEGVNYKTVKFNITEADIEAGVELFIASPPDSVMGDNDSGPGEP